MFFLFGTPIGNRTLVSAVRGRRLEPLDHEGKSILLCDNIIILPVTQAKIYIFSQKTSCVVYDSSHFCVLWLFWLEMLKFSLDFWLYMI